MNTVEIKQWMDGLNVGDRWVVSNTRMLFVRSVCAEFDMDPDEVIK